jgi:selenocysteine-specific elongation factor
VTASGLDGETVRESLDTLLAAGDVVALKSSGLAGVPLLYSADGLQAMTLRLKETLTDYHKHTPLRPGMPKEELRSRLGLPQRVFDQLLAYWVGGRDAKETGAAVALPQHEPRVTPQQDAAAQSFVAAMRASPFSPPDPSAEALDEELMAYLEAKGEIVRVAGGVAFAAEAYREMVERVSAHIRDNGSVTLAQVRDMFGTSRKYAQALLEHLDAERITRRIGDERVLRKA